MAARTEQLRRAAALDIHSRWKLVHKKGKRSAGGADAASRTSVDRAEIALRSLYAHRAARTAFQAADTVCVGSRVWRRARRVGCQQPHSTRQAATASHCELALENLRTLEQPDERTHCAHGVAYTRTTSTQNADANRVTEESRRLRTVPIAKCHRAFTCHGARLPASHPSSLLVGQREGGQSAVAMTGTIRAACQCTSVYWPPH